MLAVRERRRGRGWGQEREWCLVRPNIRSGINLGTGRRPKRLYAEPLASVRVWIQHSDSSSVYSAHGLTKTDTRHVGRSTRVAVGGWTAC